MASKNWISLLCFVWLCGVCTAQNDESSGLEDLDVNSVEAQEPLNVALLALNRGNNSPNKQKVFQVVEAQKQVVAGMMYYFKLTQAYSDCRTSDSGATVCNPGTNEDGITCNVKVLSQPWMNKTEVTEIACTPAPTRAG